jgi:hypothetical protein
MQYTDMNMVPQGSTPRCRCGLTPATGTFAGVPCCNGCARKKELAAQLGGPAGTFIPYGQLPLPLKRGPGRPRKVW